MQQGDINCKTHRTSCVQRHTIKRARAFAGVYWFGSLGTVETLEQTKPNLAPQSRGIMDVRYCTTVSLALGLKVGMCLKICYRASSPSIGALKFSE
jgi:hypothetical protein